MSAHRVIVPAALCLAGLAAGLGGSAALGQGASDRELFARLTGGQEVPRGDTNGRGAAAVTVDGREICLAIAVTNLRDVQAAHIHRGARGVNGPIVVDPRVSPESDGDGVVIGGCATVSTALARAIRRNPGRYYVNVHTSDFAAGAIRGQLRRTG